MNTKIKFGTKQSLIAKSWTSQLIELEATVCLSPLSEWKSKESKLNLLHTIHKKISREMSIHEILDQSKILFDKTAQLLNIGIHELAF
jgi:hypothetical protein